MALNFRAMAITYLDASSLSTFSLVDGGLFLTGFSGLFAFWNWPSILFTWIRQCKLDMETWLRRSYNPENLGKEKSAKADSAKRNSSTCMSSSVSTGTGGGEWWRGGEGAVGREFGGEKP